MNDEIRMTNDELNPNDETGDCNALSASFAFRDSFRLRFMQFELLKSWHRIHFIDPASVTDSLLSGLGMKRFSHLLIEGVAFAFGREAFVFRLNICCAFL